MFFQWRGSASAVERGKGSRKTSSRSIHTLIWEECPTKVVEEESAVNTGLLDRVRWEDIPTDFLLSIRQLGITIDTLFWYLIFVMSHSIIQLEKTKAFIYWQSFLWPSPPGPLADLSSVVKEASSAGCLEWICVCMVKSGLVISFRLFYLVLCLFLCKSMISIEFFPEYWPLSHRWKD